MWETWVRSLGWEDPLEKGKATHSNILAWRIHGLYSLWGHKEWDMTERLSLSPPLSQWCHPTISSSVIPFFSCPQSFPASWGFPMILHIRWPKYWSFSITLSVSIQDWFPLGLTGCTALEWWVAVRGYPMSKVRSSHEEIPQVQGKRNPTKTGGAERGDQRVDRPKPQSRKLASLITCTTAFSNSMKLSHAVVLTECGPLEKGLANHFSILALRTPWTEWKGKKIGHWKMNSPDR